jgi:hypothetical protein
MLKKGVFEASDIAGIRKMFWKYDKDNSGSLVWYYYDINLILQCDIMIQCDMINFLVIHF